MRKLLVITSNIAPYRLRWEEELAKYYDVTIAYTKDKESERKDGFLKHSSNICHIHKLNNPEDKDDPICFDVIKLLRQNKDSFVLFDGYGLKTNLLGMLYYKLCFKRRFVNVDGYALGEPKSLIKDLLKKCIIKFFCTDIFCSSKTTKNHLISLGFNKDRIYVHNFSSVTKDRILDKPLTFEEKLELRKKLNIKSEKRIILGVGNFITRKRFEDLIMAFKKSNVDADLYFLGGKPTKKYLDLIDSDTRINFIDFVKPEEVDKYYQISDLFVLPSQTDVWGLVINEAMAQGLPVISSDNCIAGLDMIKGNGVVYKTADINALKEALEYCLKDDVYNQMVIKSLEISKDYNIEGMVELQLPIIESYFKNN